MPVYHQAFLYSLPDSLRASSPRRDHLRLPPIVNLNMSASPAEQRGLPEQDKLRAPGSGDSLRSGGGTTVTFATWLRLMFQVFVLNLTDLPCQ